METGNVGVEVATEWLFSAPESATAEQHVYASGEEPLGGEGRRGGREAARRRQTALRPAFNPRTRLLRLSPADTGSPSSTGSACGLEDPCALSPKRVPLRGVRYIAAGAAHTVAVTDDATYSWGAGERGTAPLGGGGVAGLGETGGTAGGKRGWQ